MSKGRFAEEFKQEAVRQVVERGKSSRHAPLIYSTSPMVKY
jgi:transposase-like protein